MVMEARKERLRASRSELDMAPSRVSTRAETAGGGFIRSGSVLIGLPPHGPSDHCSEIKARGVMGLSLAFGKFHWNAHHSAPLLLRRGRRSWQGRHARTHTCTCTCAVAPCGVRPFNDKVLLRLHAFYQLLDGDWRHGWRWRSRSGRNSGGSVHGNLGIRRQEFLGIVQLRQRLALVDRLNDFGGYDHDKFRVGATL